MGPISSQEGPRPSSSGKIKFRGPLTKLPAHVLERSIKLGKKVAFSTGSSTSVATLAKTSFSSFTSLEPTKLLNLCEITLGKGKKRASDQDYCHGCIVAISQGRKFALYPPREQDDINLKYQQQSIAEPVEFQTTLTLRQILDSDLQGAHRVPRPRTGDKIRMAVAISESVLHMHSTPWLSKPLTLDDIVFLVNDSSIASERFKLRTFISKPVGCTPSDTKSRHDGNPTVTPSPFYPTAFYLGLLLCQLMLLEDRKLPIATEIDLKAHQVPIPPGAVVMPDSMHKKLSRNAESLLWENEESAGEDYKNIVHWCLVTHNSEKGLDDEDFRKSFYAEVVEKLREKFKHMIYDL